LAARAGALGSGDPAKAAIPLAAAAAITVATANVLILDAQSMSVSFQEEAKNGSSRISRE
jgi:hypothetical protein